MSLTTDEQIAQWREDWYQTHLSSTGKWVGEILDALEAEQELNNDLEYALGHLITAVKIGDSQLAEARAWAAWFAAKAEWRKNRYDELLEDIFRIGDTVEEMQQEKHAAEDRVDVLERVIEKVRWLHQGNLAVRASTTGHEDRLAICDECRQLYPCSTISVIDGRKPE